MAVVFDAASSTDSNNTAVTSLDLTTLTVGTGSNRALVATLNTGGDAGAGRTLTWDNGGTNQAMTAITNASNVSGSNLYMYGLVAPTSGNKTLRATFSSNKADLGAAAFTGVDQTGGDTTFPHGTNTNANSTTPSITITSAAGNIAMAGYGVVAASFNSVDNVQDWIQNDTPSSAANHAAGAASVTLGAVMSAKKAWSAVGTDILASVAAGPCGTMMM